MSLDIDWSKLDHELATHVQQFFNNHFANINKPTFIGDIQVTSFDWGVESPHIEIITVTDPFPEFYEQDEQDEQDERTTMDSALSGLPSPRSVSQPYYGSSQSSSVHQDVHHSPLTINSHSTSTTPPLLPVPLLHQGQRFPLVPSFYRSPFTTPQHLFHRQHHFMHSPSLGHGYLSASSVASTDAPHFSLENEREYDWIDDDPSLRPTHTTHPSPIRPTHSSSSSFMPMSYLHPVHPMNTIEQEKLFSQQEPPPTEMDFQAHLRIAYKGDMSMTVLTELRMNYPSMMFMSLPIQLCVRSVTFEAIAVVAYIKSMNRVCVSMLEPEEKEEDSEDPLFPHSHPRRSFAQGGLQSLLKEVHVESVVGDKEKQVLKNVDKIEKFIIDQLRKVLDDELVFPSYQCYQLASS